MQENSALGRALEVVRDLRRRCPWDRSQTRETLRPYLVEEVLELDAALRDDDLLRIREEMGDFLLHLAWQFVLAEEGGEFSPEQVVHELEMKMRRRHPHLYDIGPPEPWEQLKRKEGRGILDGLPTTLPGLLMAYRLQQRAASVGFDWPDAEGPAAKVREELAEIETAVAAGGNAVSLRRRGSDDGPVMAADEVIDEVGDLLFAVVNLARKLHVQPDLALDRANGKFRGRFLSMMRAADEKGLEVESAGLEKLDELWEEAKGREAGSGER